MSTTKDTIVDDVLEVEAGDEVRFETTYHEWANPLIVDDATAVVEWDVPEGENWRTREIVLRTDRGTNYLVSFDSHDKTRCYTLNREKKHTHNGFLRRLERVNGPDEHVCPDCEASFDDGQKLAGHRNTPNTDCTPIEGDDIDQEEDESGTSIEDDTTSESNSVSEAEEERVLEEEAAGDAPADAGDDVPEEIVSEDVTVDAVDDDGEFECSCGETFESQQALQGHGPKSCEEGDNEGIELPDGVTDDDVDELTSGGIEMGDLADELDVDVLEARAIAHDLGYYKRVREVFN